MRWNVGLSLTTMISVSLFAVACGKSGSSSTASAPANSNTSAVNAQASLNGQGRWQTIGGQNYFLPNAYQLPNGQPWAPYQNGSWAYDEDQSWSWNSDDPWGDVTDHYGIWRHHETYGWVWLAFQDMHYAPHTVTWFDDGNYIGWYPYDSGSANIYRQYGQNYGFNDGYWQGEQAALQVNTSGFNFVLGFSLVDRRQATDPMLYTALVYDPRVIYPTVYRAHQGDGLRRVGHYPGGDRTRCYDFVQQYDQNHRAPVGHSQRVTGRDGGLIIRPPGDSDPRRRDQGRRDHGQGDQHDQGQSPQPHDQGQRQHRDQGVQAQVQGQNQNQGQPQDQGGKKHHDQTQTGGQNGDRTRFDKHRVIDPTPTPAPATPAAPAASAPQDGQGRKDKKDKKDHQDQVQPVQPAPSFQPQVVQPNQQPDQPQQPRQFGRHDSNDGASADTSTTDGQQPRAKGRFVQHGGGANR